MAIPSHAQVFASSVLTGALPRFDEESALSENIADFIVWNGEFTCRIGSNAFVVEVSVFQHSLKDDRSEMRRRIMDECLNGGNLGASGKVPGGIIAKWDCTVRVEGPPGFGSGRRGEGVGWDTDIPEEGVLVGGVHGSEELLDVIFLKNFLMFI